MTSRSKPPALNEPADLTGLAAAEKSAVFEVGAALTNEAAAEPVVEVELAVDIASDGKVEIEAAAVVPVVARAKKASQSPGTQSTVYVPVILKIFRDRFRPGASSVVFSLDDVRNAVEAVRALSTNPDSISSRNPADVVYRMRSRTKLPDEILEKGFHVLRPIGRGQYQFERASSSIIEPPDTSPVSAIDATPMPVRRLLPPTVAEMDEQAVLAIVGYCQLLDHFTGMKVYRLRSHVRKSVPGVGQAELDAIDVGIASAEDETPVIFPIEAKSAADALNRVQIFNMIMYARHYFPGLKVRPLAMKVSDDSRIHFMEFNVAAKASELRVIKAASYVISTSEAQLAMIKATNVPKQ